MTNLDRVLKNRDITLPTKVCIVKAIVFPAVTYRCENWSVKKAELQCFWTVVLEKTLESPLSTKEIKPVKPKGNQPWILTGRNDAEAEAPILWQPDVKSWLMEKTLMLGKIEGRKRGQKRLRWLGGVTDTMDMSLSKPWKIVEDRGTWHALCSSCSRKELDMT